MATCDTDALFASGRGFIALPAAMSQIVRVSLLAQLLQALDADADVTPATLLENGRCFACLTAGEQKLIKIQLLCEILHAAPEPVPPGCECSAVTITLVQITVGGPPYAVHVEWTFDHGECDVATIELWRSVAGAAYQLRFSGFSTATSFDDFPTGNTGEIVCYKARYVSATLTCDFGNEGCVELQPV